MRGKQMIFNQSQRRPPNLHRRFYRDLRQFLATCDRGWDCDYDKTHVVYVFGVVCEGDVGVIISHGEFPDLVRVHVKASDHQMSGERECQRQSGIAQAGDAYIRLYLSIYHPSGNSRIVSLNRLFISICKTVSIINPSIALLARFQTLNSPSRNEYHP